MLPLAPVLAQLITLGVQDRSEARYVALTDRHYEAQSNPAAKLTFSWRHSDLALRYGASLLELPLESPSRQLLVYHSAGLETSYRLRHTTFSVLDTASYGEQNFQTLTLNNPANNPMTPPNGEPTQAGATPGQQPPSNTAQPPSNSAQMPSDTAQAAPGTVQQVKAVNRTVHYVVNVTSLNLVHVLNRQVQFGGGATYSLGGGLDAAEKTDPITSSVSVTAFADHTLKLFARDSVTTTTRATDTHSSNGNHSSTWLANDTWHHPFDRRTSASLGAGISVLRLAQDSGLTAYTIFPTFVSGLTHDRLLAHGHFNARLGVFAAPVADLFRGTVDPRISSTLGLGWTRGRFTLAASGGTSTSVAARIPGNNAGAFSGYNATGSSSYRLTDWLAAEAGGRMAKQQYQGQQLLPLSYGLFVALAFGYDWKLSRQN